MRQTINNDKKIDLKSLDRTYRVKHKPTKDTLLHQTVPEDTSTFQQ